MIIEGRIEEISKGSVENGSLHHVEFIKVDGKRYQDLKFDNYISTALSNAMRDGGKTAISIHDRKIVVSVKRENGEVSRKKHWVFGKSCGFQLNAILD